MYNCREEITREFTYVFLLVSAVALTISASPADLKYKCDESGVVLAELSTMLGHIAVASGSGNSLTYCRPDNLNLANCKNGKGTNSLTVLYEDVTTSGIIGGKKTTFKFYKLTCSDEAMKVTHDSIIFTAKAEPTDIHQENGKITHDFTLQLTKDGTGVTEQTDLKIGDSLSLQMTGTDVVISPDICSAYPKGDNSSKVTIWEASGNTGSKQCKNTESSVISTKKWSYIADGKPGIQIELFAFRFATKAAVAIECTATVCSKSKNNECSKECVLAVTAATSSTVQTPPTSATSTTVDKKTQPPAGPVDNSRKRRSVAIIEKNDARRKRSSSVSFAVRENKAQYNSSQGLSVGYIKFVMIGLVLMFIS